ncbi:MAG: SRPBCC family protein [Beijerinckiaceae bacterium]|nr:SRPBCC family protein [Beijerinckiaceae bacterium]
MIRSLAIVTALLLFPGAALAQGCGPTRLKVVESVTLDVPAAEAWRLVGNFEDMSWAKNTTSTLGSGGNEPEKALRKVTLANGAVLEESLYRYDAASMTYSYHIDRVDPAVLPVQNTSVTLEVVPAEGGAKSTLRWRAAFYRFLRPGEPAPDIADAEAAKAVSALARQMLAGLKGKTDAKT